MINSFAARHQIELELVLARLLGTVDPHLHDGNVRGLKRLLGMSVKKKVHDIDWGPLTDEGEEITGQNAIGRNFSSF